MSTTSNPPADDQPVNQHDDVSLEALVNEVQKLREEVKELRADKQDLQDRVARLEAEDRKAVHRAENAEDAAQTAVGMAKDAKDVVEDVQEETEQRGKVYKELVGKVNTFEGRLNEFHGELELSEYDSTSTKDRVKRVLIDHLGYKAYQSRQRSRKKNAPAVAGIAYGAVHEVAGANHIDISREYGYTIARELVEEKDFVRMKSGGERNTGKAKKLKLRYDDLPPALQDRARDLYRENNSGGD
ncbi:hypothetical protein SAMN04488063_0032 [Halopelagius inordinatus]|uniref:Uncharacterized protein n=1 Tax=Halopelagius inordinatus TaxID=553467 RepID=A0A1I2WW75_9EURY|nr:hypothetical protein [Halopelagius inordinatus]SFH05568.1 hypothetical protein SAMN04488063_0032 [Halopelagius inordinatus]